MDIAPEMREANRKLREQLNERWYPQFHIAAPAGWINDPNGLCFYKGRYHVYFQHHPAGTQWGPMHWGHVSSTDMVTWRREPIALAPSLDADLGGIFSGSAVEGDDGRLYAFYTGNAWNNGIDDTDGARQVQCLAISEDGIEFEKHGVVVDAPEGISDFRDPKVWKEGDTWRMVFGVSSLQGRAEVWMYTSTNLLEWDFEQVIYQDPREEVFMIECPDLFPLGDKWVLIYGPMFLKPDGYRFRNGHNAGYVVGTWEPGGTFEPETKFRPLDWGHNFYAPQTFLAPDGRRILYGWMGSFSAPIASAATDGWSGQLTLPRELRLDTEAGLRLLQLPLAGLEALYGPATEFGATRLEQNTDLVLNDDVDAYEVRLTVNRERTTAERFGLLVDAVDGDVTYVFVDQQSGRLGIDRGRNSIGDRGYRAAPLPEASSLELRVIVDRGSVELYAQGGQVAMASFSFPKDGARKVVLTCESGALELADMQFRPIRGHWE